MQRQTGFTPAELRTLIEFHRAHRQAEPAPAEQDPDATSPAPEPARVDPAPRNAGSLPVMIAMRQTIEKMIANREGNEWHLLDLQLQREEIERQIERFRDEYAAGLQETAAAYSAVLTTASQAAAVSAALLAEKDAMITRLIASQEAAAVSAAAAAIAAEQAAPAPAEPASALTPEAWIANPEIAAVLDRHCVIAGTDPDPAGYYDRIMIFSDDFVCTLSPAITPQDLDRILQLWQDTGATNYQQGREDGADQAKTAIRRALGLED